MARSEGTGRLKALAWRVAAAVPWPAWRPLVAVGAFALAVRPNGPVRQWQRNFELITGRSPAHRDTVRGLLSWGRNTIESLQLASWGPAKTNRVLVIHPEHEARLKQTAARGAVLGLPHTGSWDLAGAWACVNGMPVSSVAEELLPDEFQVFLNLREALGMRIYSHQDTRALPKLIRDVRDEGRMVCLMADRDFSRRGLPVVWETAAGLLDITMPPGPALVALRGRATLLGVAAHYEGRHMRLVVSEPLTPAEHLTTDADRAADLTQQLADFFAAFIAEHPHDWHMLSPFFPGDAR